MSKPICPICGDDSLITKVSAIVRAGTTRGFETSTSESRGKVYPSGKTILTRPGKFILGEGKAQTETTTSASTTQQTDLAEALGIICYSPLVIPDWFEPITPPPPPPPLPEDLPTTPVDQFRHKILRLVMVIDLIGGLLALVVFFLSGLLHRQSINQLPWGPLFVMAILIACFVYGTEKGLRSLTPLGRAENARESALKANAKVVQRLRAEREEAWRVYWRKHWDRLY